MTVEQHSRSSRVGLVLAVLLFAYTAWLFVLSLVVWQQGLPQDYDSIETTSSEAIAVSRLTVAGLLLCPALFIASLVCLRAGSWNPQRLTVISAVLLFVAFLSGMFGLRTWGGFGW